MNRTEKKTFKKAWLRQVADCEAVKHQAVLAVVSRQKATVNREYDATAMVKYSFKSGYTLIGIGGWDLIDPKGHRVAWWDPSFRGGRGPFNYTLSLHHLPTLDQIEDAFDWEDREMEKDPMGDPAQYV